MGNGYILLMSGYAAACADEMRLHRTTEWWGYATATRRCGCLRRWAKTAPKAIAWLLSRPIDKWNWQSFPRKPYSEAL